MPRSQAEATAQKTVEGGGRPRYPAAPGTGDSQVFYRGLKRHYSSHSRSKQGSASQLLATDKSRDSTLGAAPQSETTTATGKAAHRTEPEPTTCRTFTNPTLNSQHQHGMRRLRAPAGMPTTMPTTDASIKTSACKDHQQRKNLRCCCCVSKRRAEQSSM